MGVKHVVSAVLAAQAPASIFKSQNLELKACVWLSRLRAWLDTVCCKNEADGELPAAAEERASSTTCTCSRRGVNIL